MDVLCLHIRGHLVGEICAAHEIAHVATELDYQSRELYGDGPVRCAALLQSLAVGFEMRTEQLLQIGVKRSVPGDGEDLAGGRHEFVHDLSRGRPEFMHRVGACMGNAQTGLKMGLIGLDASGVAAQNCECRHGKN